MNPLTTKLQNSIIEYVNRKLEPLGDQWFWEQNIAISHDFQPIQTLECCGYGQDGVVICLDIEHLLSAFHPSLPSTIDEVPGKRTALITQFVDSTLKALLDNSEPVKTNDFFHTTNHFQPIVKTTLNVGSIVIGHLFLLPEYLDEQWPLEIKRGAPIRQAADAHIEDHTVTLTVLGGTVLTSLASIRNLKPGSVLTSQHHISQPLTVNADNKPVFEAYLGKQSPHLAIVVR